ncbi:MAG: Bax inhibitor-1 family protein [Candidatus Omnitrophica bacterium]|jgi:FtsH-binding integral membrane protein|nr:Bax inhibitor-1 family protein [Candidatus Omnitrophota bacterium]
MLFPTLMSKTFFILSLSLTLCYVGAQLVLSFFRKAHREGKSFVTSKINKYGQQDLIVEPKLIIKIFWAALIINILCFIGLMFTRASFPLNMLMMGLFTFTDGITLGIVLISIDENLAIKVAWLTAIITFFAGTIGLYSKIDFSFLGGLLFWALIGLIIVTFFRIFVSIKGRARKIIAFIGILIFVGYLLYDFNKIKKLKNLANFNNWNTALDCSIDIYLDIINLFLQLLDLLSEN